MNASEKETILCIDGDSRRLGRILETLSAEGHEPFAASTFEQAMDLIRRIRPALLLLDGELAGREERRIAPFLREGGGLQGVPIVLLSGPGGRRPSLDLGAFEVLDDPIDVQDLMDLVRKHLRPPASSEDQKSREEPAGKKIRRIFSADFREFKDRLCERLNLPPEKRKTVLDVLPSQVYTLPSKLGVPPELLTQAISEFLGVPIFEGRNLQDLRPGFLSQAFCSHHKVASLESLSGEKTVVLSNPFDWDLRMLLPRVLGENLSYKIAVADPSSVESLLQALGGPDAKPSLPEERPESEPREGCTLQMKVPAVPELPESKEEDEEERKILGFYENVLRTAIQERASDIHFEPKETKTLIRFRIDGDMRDAWILKNKTGIMLISRLKALAGMDIAEKRRPQDGGLGTTIAGRTFKLRLATTSTPFGESLIIRLLEPNARPKPLTELGMTPEQSETLVACSEQEQGLILVVGPTGSGKTTTIFSLIGRIDCKTRSLITVEDPVEYNIPFANQQQVNERAGVNFESLLKSAVRQDPDVLFLGEIRDPFSAKVAVDFASTGHLTISTLHTANATSAIFRLGRLGVNADTVADSLLCVVAQKLVKKLCRECKRTAPITSEETEWLAPFLKEVPAQVAHPGSCPHCHNSGYLGREGIYEVMTFDSEIVGMMRSGVAISEIRAAARNRGHFQMAHHAAAKVAQHLFSPKDIFTSVLADELKAFPEKKVHPENVPEAVPAPEPPAAPEPPPPPPPTSILVVEDDETSWLILQRILESDGHKVVRATDGAGALLLLGKEKFDLILSDIQMPNLDGFQLLEFRNQKEMKIPVILLTGREGEESRKKALALGAADFLQKPIRRKMLAQALEKALEGKS